MTIFWSAMGSSHHPPIPPQQCCGQTKHSFPPMVLKINFVWGGRGGVTSFTNITGNVLTLLTSIVPIRGWSAIALRHHHTATLTHNNLLLHGFYSQDGSSVPPRFHYWIDYLKSEPIIHCLDQYKIQISIPACAISSEFFMITLLQLVRLRNLWMDKITLKIFTSNSRKLGSGINFITASYVNITTRYTDRNAEMKLKSTTASRFNFWIIIWLMESCGVCLTCLDCKTVHLSMLS